MTCPACGQEERQEEKHAVARRPPPGERFRLILHHECSSGHAWHTPLLIEPGTPPAPCDCADQ